MILPEDLPDQEWLEWLDSMYDCPPDLDDLDFELEDEENTR